MEYGKTVLVTLLIALVIKAFVVEAFRIPSGSMENTLLVGDFLLVNKLAYGIRTPHRGDVVVFEFPGIRRDEDAGEQSNYIKRCIGLPGDTITIRQSRVFIDGRELLFSRTVKNSSGYSAFSRGVSVVPAGSGFTENEYGPVVVPKRGDVVHLDETSFEQWRAFIVREGHSARIDSRGTVFVNGQPVQTYAVEQDYYFVLGDNRNNSLDSRFWGFVPEDNLVGEALMVYWSWNPDISLLEFNEKLKSVRWERFGMLVR